jgi:hypothetical protein
LVLGEVEETVYVIDEDDEEENVRTVKKQSEMLFVRGAITVLAGLREISGADDGVGDSVVLISPQQ